jgi:hypothetical protein
MPTQEAGVAFHDGDAVYEGQAGVCNIIHEEECGNFGIAGLIARKGVTDDRVRVEARVAAVQLCLASVGSVLEIGSREPVDKPLSEGLCEKEPSQYGQRVTLFEALVGLKGVSGAATREQHLRGRVHREVSDEVLESQR